MIITKRQNTLTKDDLLQRIDPLDIYKWYIPGIEIKKKMRSPLRLDKHEGSWGIFRHEDTVLWKDWATEESGDCIKMVQLMYGITHNKAVEKIAQDMGISVGTTVMQRVITDRQKEDKKHCLIQVTARKGYTKEDIDYWGQFLVTEEQLIAEGIHSITELYINRCKVPLNAKEKAYAYEYPDNKFKIYLPDRQKEAKWFSNIPTKLVEGLDKLNGHQKVVICKSKKDRCTLTSLLPSNIGIIQTQNESISAYSEELLQILDGRLVWISYDSDGPGKAASNRVNAKYPWMKHINVPDQWAPIKDWSDMAKAGMSNKIIEHFKTKGVIE